MARAVGISAEQLRALGRLSKVAASRRLYLAGGAAIAFHLRHRESRDLNLFGPKATSFASFRALSAKGHVTVIDESDATLRMQIDDVPVDIVRYPYPLLEKPLVGVGGFAIPTLLDLATMKISALSRRGLARDFWDLYAIVDDGLPLDVILAAYVDKFGVGEADVYHVMRSLTYFDDATKESPRPIGLTPSLWKKVQAFFVAESARLLDRAAPEPSRRR